MNVTANAFLIPAYGPIGAAISMVISVPVFSLFMSYQLKREEIPLRIDRRWGKAVLAGGVLSAVLLLPVGLPLIVSALAGALSYGAVLIALRTLDDEDLEMLPGRRWLGWLVRRPRKTR